MCEEQLLRFPRRCSVVKLVLVWLSFQGWKASLARIKVEGFLGLGILSEHKVALQEFILYCLIHFLS